MHACCPRHASKADPIYKSLAYVGTHQPPNRQPRTHPCQPLTRPNPHPPAPALALALDLDPTVQQEFLEFELTLGHTVDSELAGELRRTRAEKRTARVILGDTNGEDGSVPGGPAGGAYASNATNNDGKGGGGARNDPLEAASVLRDLTELSSQGVLTLLDRMPREQAAPLRLLFGRPIPPLVRVRAWHLSLDNPLTRERYKAARKKSMLQTMSRYDREITEMSRELLKSVYGKGAWYTTGRLMVMKSVISYHHAASSQAAEAQSNRKQNRGQPQALAAAELEELRPPEELYWLLLPIIAVYVRGGGDDGIATDALVGGVGLDEGADGRALTLDCAEAFSSLVELHIPKLITAPYPMESGQLQVPALFHSYPLAPSPSPSVPIFCCLPTPPVPAAPLPRISRFFL